MKLKYDWRTLKRLRNMNLISVPYDFFGSLKNLPMERFILYSIHFLSSGNYYFFVLMKKIVSFSMFFIIKGCRNMEHRVAFSRS